MIILKKEKKKRKERNSDLEVAHPHIGSSSTNPSEVEI